MKWFLKRIHRDSKGFTLRERLVAVAIIGVLAALIVPHVTGLMGHGEAKAARGELVTIQTAMDTMMAKEDLSSVTEVTEATSTMSSFPDGTNPLYPDYLRIATTKGTYTCNTSGLVTQASTG